MQGESAPGTPVAERIMSVAAALFREKGYAGTTTRELAAALGIRNASLYHHIGNKEDLLYRLCVHALQHIHDGATRALSQAATPAERLRALIRAHVITALADQDAHATMLIELRALSEARRREVRAQRDRYETVVRQALEEAQVAGVLRPDVPARHLTLSLLNLLNWPIFWFRPDGELTPEELAALLTTIFLDGAAGGPAAGLAGRTPQGTSVVKAAPKSTK